MMEPVQFFHPIVITLSVSLLVVIGAGSFAKKARYLPLIVSSLLAILAIVASLELALSGESGALDKEFLKASYLGEFNFKIDYISGPIAITVLLVSLLISVYAYPYMERKIEEEKEDLLREMRLFYILYYIFAISMFASVISTNFIEFYLFLETGLISSFILINNYGYGDRRKIAIMYLVWTHIGAVLFLVGSLAFGYILGSFNIFTDVGSIVSTAAIGSNIARAIFILMLIGMLVKAAAFGFHLWLPYAHAEAPTPISALLSPLLIGTGPYIIFRFIIPLFPAQFEALRTALAFWGVLTIVYGGLNALFEKDFKRFLAYSSISQMGYLITAVAAGNIYGYIGLLLHYIAHAFGKATLFGSAGSIIYHENELRDIRKMGGLLKALPITGNSALVGFFTITGMPPTIGFWSELFIVRGVAEAFLFSGAEGIAIIALLFLGFSLSISYAFYTYKNVFQGPPKIEERKRENAFIAGSLVALAAASVILFIFGPSLANILAQYMSSMGAVAGGA